MTYSDTSALEARRKHVLDQLAALNARFNHPALSVTLELVARDRASIDDAMLACVELLGAALQPGSAAAAPATSRNKVAAAYEAALDITLGSPAWAASCIAYTDLTQKIAEAYRGRRGRSARCWLELDRTLETFRAAIHAYRDERRAGNPTGLELITERDRIIWRSAMLMANNLCADIANRAREEDVSDDRIAAASDCAAAIRSLVEIDMRTAAKLVHVIYQIGSVLDMAALVQSNELAPPAIAPVETDASRDVLAERERQKTVELFAPWADDRYTDRTLAKAALGYCQSAAGCLDNVATTPPGWPWPADWWKPTSPRRDLVKAGALILAEIERLDRAAAAAAPVVVHPELVS